MIDGAGQYLVPGLTDAHVHLELDERRPASGFPVVRRDVGVQPSRRTAPPHAASRRGRRARRWADEPTLGAVRESSRRFRRQRCRGRRGRAENRPATTSSRFTGTCRPKRIARSPTQPADSRSRSIGHAPRDRSDSAGSRIGKTWWRTPKSCCTHTSDPDTTGSGARPADCDDANVWLTPNLVAYTLIARQIGPPGCHRSMLAFPDARVLDSAMIRFWRSGMYTNRALETAPGYERNRRFLVLVTNGLHQAGVPMLAGTIRRRRGIYPGRSLHDELDIRGNAGVLENDALAAATVRIPGPVHQSAMCEGPRGLVRSRSALAPTSRCSIRNPLDDSLSVLRAPRGVMAAGRWFDRTELDRRCETSLALVVERRGGKRPRSGRRARTHVLRLRLQTQCRCVDHSRQNDPRTNSS